MSNTNNRFEPMNQMNEVKHHKNSVKKQSKPSTSAQNTTNTSTSVQHSNWNQKHIISKIKNNIKNNPIQTTPTDPLLIQVMKYKNDQLKNTENNSDTSSELSDDAISIASTHTTVSDIQRRNKEEFDLYIRDRYYIYEPDYEHYIYNNPHQEDESEEDYQSRVIYYLEDLEQTFGTNDEYICSFNYNNYSD